MNFPRFWQNIFAALAVAFACWLGREVMILHDDVITMKVDLGRLIRLHDSTKPAIALIP